MLGLFVHDHKFPRSEKGYYYSYGFDEEFFNRYLSIFNEMSVVGRDSQIDFTQSTKLDKVHSDIDFLTINNLKQLRKKNVRSMIAEKIINSDYIVIRVPSILGLYAAKIAKKNKKPYLIEVVGCSWDAIANKGMRGIFPAIIITHLTKKAIYSADYVVYVTEKFLENRYPTKGDYIACSNVTLNSVEEEDLNKRLKKIESKKDNKFVIGTCATLDVIYKGQQDVIEAMAKMKKEGIEIEYQLVGGGDTSRLDSIAKKHGVREQIQFVGSLKHEEVFNWLDNIDVYVHPSRQEGLSRAIIEAMSKGCPVMGADAGGIHEQIDEDYIFDKGSIRGICDTLKKFDKTNMVEQSIKNHKNSKKYLKSILSKRRNKFFERFIKGI